ncbi:potassium channel family protein [Halobacillus massiliensis]|uniref:potassium channel family protein n=1 Tax=Halobacillus massiliensis TaxID=1926286 RepID=UPI0009E3CC26|nr:potassium channel family protein [Halobacillus massiliensis]
MKKKIHIVYELCMLILIFISLFFAFSTNENFQLYDRIIWIIFVMDYLIHLLRSRKKWAYIKSHPLELIAIIPLDSIFRTARFARVLRVLRLLSMGAHYIKPLYGLLKTNGLDKILMAAIILLFIIPIPIILVEPEINTFPDALWWAIVTTTTVGYGDISPTTPLGRILAVLLMLVGIGIIGTFTSAITSYFQRKENPSSHEDELNNIIISLQKIDHLTEEDRELINLYIKRKKHSSSKP